MRLSSLCSTFQSVNLLSIADYTEDFNRIIENHQSCSEELQEYSVLGRWVGSPLRPSEDV